MTCECGTKIQIAGNATVGDSLINPFDAMWLYAMCKYHDWKCVDTQDGVNFTIHTSIEVGNGADPTYLRDYGHNFTFDPGHDFLLNPPAYIEIGGSTDWTISERNQIRDALGIDGDKTDSVGGQLQKVRKFTTNREKMAANRLTRYEDDAVTPLEEFDLFDENGVPTMRNVTERRPV